MGSQENKMTDIDTILNEMRTAPADPRLEGIDDHVIAGARSRRNRSQAHRSMAVTGLLALSAGLFFSVSPGGAKAETSRSLNAVPLIAPSNLLLGAG
jgi:hypothetical protein